MKYLLAKFFLLCTAIKLRLEFLSLASLLAKACEKKTSSNGKLNFSLKAANGQIIGSSEMYESGASRDNGISHI